MKTKLLTICLLLLSSQVFADEIKIKCKNPHTGHTSYYKYLDNQEYIKVQYKQNLEWLDYLNYEEIPHLDGKIVVKRDIKEKGFIIRNNQYDLKGNKTRREVVHYIDFELPSEKFISFKFDYSYEVECKFLK